MRFSGVIGERSAAMTDVVLVVLAAGIVVYLWRCGRHEPWKRGIWAGVFGLVAIMAALGSISPPPGNTSCGTAS
jgi:hypothetical protein